MTSDQKCFGKIFGCLVSIYYEALSHSKKFYSFRNTVKNSFRAEVRGKRHICQTVPPSPTKSIPIKYYEISYQLVKVSSPISNASGVIKLQRVTDRPGQGGLNQLKTVKM